MYVCHFWSLESIFENYSKYLYKFIDINHEHEISVNKNINYLHSSIPLYCIITIQISNKTKNCSEILQ